MFKIDFVQKNLYTQLAFDRDDLHLGHVSTPFIFFFCTLLNNADSKKYPDIILEGGKQILLFFSGRKVRKQWNIQEGHYRNSLI
jgi:hypothetical protein